MANARKWITWFEPWDLAKRRAQKAYRLIKGLLSRMLLGGLLTTALADAIVSTYITLPPGFRWTFYLAGILGAPVILGASLLQLLAPLYQLICITPAKGLQPASISISSGKGCRTFPADRLVNWRLRRLRSRAVPWLLRIKYRDAKDCLRSVTLPVSPKIDPEQLDPKKIALS